jgi:hypothetical protein
MDTPRVANLIQSKMSLPGTGCNVSLQTHSVRWRCYADTGHNAFEHPSPRKNLVKYYCYAFDSSLRLAAVAAGLGGTLPTHTRRGRHRHSVFGSLGA